MSSNRCVFINCPFDDEYLEMFHAIFFVVKCFGFEPECAKDYSANQQKKRMDNICELVLKCKYAIHDISRTESNIVRGREMPRFNMPFELGLSMGANLRLPKKKRTKILIFDKEAYDYDVYFSDLKAYDISCHNNNVDTFVSILAQNMDIWVDSTLAEYVSAKTVKKKYQAYKAFLNLELKELNEELKNLNTKRAKQLITSFLSKTS